MCQIKPREMSLLSTISLGADLGTKFIMKFVDIFLNRFDELINWQGMHLTTALIKRKVQEILT